MWARPVPRCGRENDAQCIPRVLRHQDRARSVLAQGYHRQDPFVPAVVPERPRAVRGSATFRAV